MMTTQPELRLKNFTFDELQHSTGLNRLDQTFLDYLKNDCEILHAQLLTYRQHTASLSTLEISELLISCAKVLENFLAEFFAIQEEVAISQAKTISNNPISVFKKYFAL